MFVSLAADGCVDLSADGVKKASQTTNQFRCPLTNKENWRARFVTTTSRKFGSREARSALNPIARMRLSTARLGRENLGLRSKERATDPQRARSVGERPTRRSNARSDVHERPTRRSNARSDVREHPIRRSNAMSDVHEHPTRRSNARSDVREHPIRRSNAMSDVHEHPIRRSNAMSDVHERPTRGSNAMSDVHERPTRGSNATQDFAGQLAAGRERLRHAGDASISWASTQPAAR